SMRGTGDGSGYQFPAVLVLTKPTKASVSDLNQARSARSMMDDSVGLSLFIAPNFDKSLMHQRRALAMDDLLLVPVEELWAMTTFLTSSRESADLAADRLAALAEE